MTPFSERADRAVAKLRTDIEALATEVHLSDNALNDFGGQHTVVANGAIRQEGELSAPWPGIGVACAKTYEIAASLSAHHKGDQVTLFWRIFPKWESVEGEDEDGPTTLYKTYARFSFAINGHPSMTRADVDAILNYRQPTDDDAVAQARAQISDEQMAAWAEEVACYAIGGLGPLVKWRNGNMLTLDGKVPYLSAAHRIAILQAAVDYTRITA